MDKEEIPAGVAEARPRIPRPVVLDIGSKSNKAIKRLKNGKGKLMADVHRAVDEVHALLPDEDKKKQIIPVLIICKKKKKKGSRGRGLLPFTPFSPFNFLR